MTSSVHWPLPAGVQAMYVNGYPMAYVEHGSGVPVVLVHGTNGDYRSWTHQMEPLGAKYRAISVSLRHYYPEPWDGAGEFSARQHVADVIAFIEQLNAGRISCAASCWSSPGCRRRRCCPARPTASASPRCAANVRGG